MKIVRMGGVAALAVVGLTGCERTNGPVPDADTVVAAYESELELSAEVTGAVATLYVEQSPMQLRRGGPLWAKVGPYVFLFTEETRGLFEAWPGLTGVQVVTRVGNATVASAVLGRGELSDLLWRRSLNIAGLARRDGTNRMTLLEDLVEWGEAHTIYEYNERYTRR